MPPVEDAHPLDNEAVVDALRRRGWGTYSTSKTRVLRSPDRSLFILRDFCSTGDIVATATQWEPKQSLPSN